MTKKLLMGVTGNHKDCLWRDYRDPRYIESRVPSMKVNVPKQSFWPRSGWYFRVKRTIVRPEASSDMLDESPVYLRFPQRRSHSGKVIPVSGVRNSRIGLGVGRAAAVSPEFPHPLAKVVITSKNNVNLMAIHFTTK
jgi:hypothetical protein